MIAVLKWTTIIWLGVLAACAACYLMFIYEVLVPLAWIVGSVLIPIVLAPVFVVLVLTPGSASEWVFATNAAIALYVWLLALVCLGSIVKAWHEQQGASSGRRLPTTAMY